MRKMVNDFRYALEHGWIDAELFERLSAKMNDPAFREKLEEVSLDEDL